MSTWSWFNPLSFGEISHTAYPCCVYWCCSWWGGWTDSQIFSYCLNTPQWQNARVPPGRCRFSRGWCWWWQRRYGDRTSFCWWAWGYRYSGIRLLASSGLYPLSMKNQHKKLNNNLFNIIKYKYPSSLRRWNRFANVYLILAFIAILWRLNSKSLIEITDSSKGNSCGSK